MILAFTGAELAGGGEILPPPSRARNSEPHFWARVKEHTDSRDDTELPGRRRAERMHLVTRTASSIWESSECPGGRQIAGRAPDNEEGAVQLRRGAIGETGGALQGVSRCRIHRCASTWRVVAAMLSFYAI